MPRPAIDADVFAAIAEPRRRRILDLLAQKPEHPVNDIVEAVGLPQPAVSKHLAVLRRAGLVTVSKKGQHRMYALNGGELRRVHAWAATFERFWTVQIERIKQRAEREARVAASEPSPPAARPGRATRQSNPKEN